MSTLRRLWWWSSLPGAWLCFALIMVLPIWRLPQWTYWWLLPGAGVWAYRDDAWIVYCRRHWIKTGVHPPPMNPIPEPFDVPEQDDTGVSSRNLRVDVSTKALQRRIIK